MYISEVFAENFRVFGSANKALSLKLEPGLNALVGENDGGKTAVVDAIRFCLWTTSQDFHRLTEDDFHCNSAGRTNQLKIRCKFDGLDTDDQATFLEWLTTDGDDHFVLYVHLRASLLQGTRRGRVAIETHAGRNGEGPSVEGMMRELLKATYLKPLRDAEAELSPGRNSRLSQILSSHPEIALQAVDDFDPSTPTSGTTLVGIMKRAEHEVGINDAVQSANDRINTQYLEKFQIGAEPLRSEVGVAGDTSLGRILDKLELVLAKSAANSERTRRGLGYNNALFMSAELLLLGTREAYPTLLIEEPEAHLHPQMQANVIALLNQQTGHDENPIDETTGRAVQVVLTTHSPNLASAIPLDRITLISGGSTFSLARGCTLLSDGDYAFLERFLDATKANLFFARGVAIVEGDAENLLLPSLAEAVGLSFRAHGVSVVNVGHTGLFRYSNIFRRSDGVALPIRVACIRDRDIVPDFVPDEHTGNLKKEKDLTPEKHAERIAKFSLGDGGAVKTFVSDSWTLEYDLAKSSWEMAAVMQRAVTCAIEAEKNWPGPDKVMELFKVADEKIKAWKEESRLLAEVAWTIFEPLKKGEASKAITAQFASQVVTETALSVEHLPAYLIKAFRHVCGVNNDTAD